VEEEQVEDTNNVREEEVGEVVVKETKE